MEKKKSKYLFVFCMLAALAVLSVGLTMGYASRGRGKDGRPFTVVTSFYPVYIAALNIVGDCDVVLENLSEPQTGCLHDYQLTPEDMKLLSEADAFIINGGGIEGFLSEVAREYPELTVINAGEGIELSGDNPHAWMSIPDYMKQVEQIADALSELDEENRYGYAANCAGYLEKLERLERRQQDVAENVREQGVILFHEAFEYVADDYGLAVAGSMDLDEERQVSAGEIADVVNLIRTQHVGIILAEELYGRQVCETVQKETDVKAVYLDPCTRGDYSADSYLEAMEGNIALLEAALVPEHAAD